MNIAEQKVFEEAQNIVDDAKAYLSNKKDKNYIIEQVSSSLIKQLTPILQEISQSMKDAVSQYLEGIKSIRLEPPSVTVQPTQVNIPEIKAPIIPEIKIPEIKLPTIIIPEIKIPVIKVPTIKVPKSEIKVNVPEIKMPTEMKVKGMEELIRSINEVLRPKEISDNPMRVVLTDEKGMEYTAKGGSVVSGGGGVVSVVRNEVPLGFEQLAVSSTAVGLASIPEKANKAVMTVEDATLRYRDDGTAPTATVGLKVFSAGTIILNSRSSIMAFKSIITGATNSEINVLYYEVS